MMLARHELVKGIKAEGILIDTLRTACQTINAECHFVVGNNLPDCADRVDG